MRTIIKNLITLYLFGAFISAQAQCVPGFSFVALSAGTYSFTNLTTNTSPSALFYYGFGNGQTSGPSTNANPTTTYSTNQVYTVTLWVTDSVSGCFANTAQTLTITNIGCNASPQISSQNSANGWVTFNMNAGQSPTISWNYGDGNVGTSSSHSYSVSGIYNVSATVTIQGGLCTYTPVTTITVNVAPCTLNAGFTYSTAPAGLVNFYSTSTGTTSSTSYYWNFGDGNSGFSPNPNHVYSNPGFYQVFLTVTDSSVGFLCTGATSMMVNVTNCPNQTSFWMMKDSTQLLTWNAYPQYPSNISGATWSWGDGSSTTGLYPSHSYSAAGTYTVCLSATVSCGSSTTTCVSSAIYKPAGGESGGGMVTLNVVDVLSVGVPRIASALKLRIFPNPSTGVVQLEGLSGRTMEVSVKDVLGRSLLSKLVHGDGPLDLGQLADGVYYLQATDGSAQFTQKIMLGR